MKKLYVLATVLNPQYKLAPFDIIDHNKIKFMLKEEVKLFIKAKENITLSSDSDEQIDDQYDQSHTDSHEESENETADIKKETHSIFWKCFDDMLQEKSSEENEEYLDTIKPSGSDQRRKS